MTPRRRTIVTALAATAIGGAVIASSVLAGDDNRRSDAIASCQAELTAMMRDPASVRFEDITAEQGEEEPHGWLVAGGYYARNGFGGMNADSFVCVTGPDGADPEVFTGEMLDG